MCPSVRLSHAGIEQNDKLNRLSSNLAAWWPTEASFLTSKHFMKFQQSYPNGGGRQYTDGIGKVDDFRPVFRCISKHGTRHEHNHDGRLIGSGT